MTDPAGSRRCQSWLMISQLMVMSASTFTKGTRQWSVPVKPSSLSIAPSATGTPNSWLLARVSFPMPPRRSSTPRSSMRVVVPVEALEDVAVLVADHRVRPVVFQALCGGLHLAPHRGGVQRPAQRQNLVEQVGGQPVGNQPGETGLQAGVRPRRLIRCHRSHLLSLPRTVRGTPCSSRAGPVATSCGSRGMRDPRGSIELRLLEGLGESSTW